MKMLVRKDDNTVVYYADSVELLENGTMKKTLNGESVIVSDGADLDIVDTEIIVEIGKYRYIDGDFIAIPTPKRTLFEKFEVYAMFTPQKLADFERDQDTNIAYFRRMLDGFTKIDTTNQETKDALLYLRFKNYVTDADLVTLGIENG